MMINEDYKNRRFHDKELSKEELKCAIAYICCIVLIVAIFCL
jgi:hypothetical protein